MKIYYYYWYYYINMWENPTLACVCVPMAEAHNSVCLQDAEISESKARELYLNLVENMWTMYRECRLVHADLSEFNLL